MKKVDVVIVGAGVAGLALARLLLKLGLSISIVDKREAASTWSDSAYGKQVVAMNDVAKTVLSKCDVWEKIADKRVSPYRKMVVWDEKTSGSVTFAANEIARAELGHIIEYDLMQTVLWQSLEWSERVQFYLGTSVRCFDVSSESVSVTLEDDTELSAQLIVGADGARSWVRKQMQVDVKEKDYNQLALVARVQTEKSHEQTAWQRFLETGPLAFLPLMDSHQSSIVWSCDATMMSSLMASSQVDLETRLTEAFSFRLGKVTFLDEPVAFPLVRRHASSYVANRIALVADAAHNVHPLAGQGLNLGFADVLELSDVISKAHAKQRDFSALDTLRRYERARKEDTVKMIAFLEGIKSLFAAQSVTVQRARGVGLDFVDGNQLLKNYFIRQAMT